MGLRRLADAVAGRPQRRPGEGEDAALAVRAGDQRAADGELRIAERAEERPRPAEAEADAESTALLDRGERLRVPRAASPGGAEVRGERHSRVSSSS